MWLSSLVLGLEIGWDTDASKTAWLGWRWEGNKQVPDETSRITLPLGKDGADVVMPRVTDCYRHLGSDSKAISTADQMLQYVSQNL